MWWKRKQLRSDSQLSSKYRSGALWIWSTSCLSHCNMPTPSSLLTLTSDISWECPRDINFKSSNRSHLLSLTSLGQLFKPPSWLPLLVLFQPSLATRSKTTSHQRHPNTITSENGLLRSPTLLGMWGNSDSGSSCFSFSSGMSSF